MQKVKAGIWAQVVAVILLAVSMIAGGVAYSHGTFATVRDYEAIRQDIRDLRQEVRTVCAR